MELLIIAVLLILPPGCFWLGWSVHRTNSIDYKERWQTASRLLEEERLKTIGDGSPTKNAELARMVLDAKKSKPKDKKALPATSHADQLKLIHKMGSSARWQLEGERLNKKLPVIDDLEGMSSYYVAEMMKRRIRHGIG